MPESLFLKVIVLGVATGAISFVITKAAIFNPLHDWLEKKSSFLEELFSCPLCTSHWVAFVFTVIYHPLLLDRSNRSAWQDILITPVDYLVTIMIMVVIAAVTARVIYSAYKSMMG